MTFFDSIPALVRMTLIFVLVLYGIRKKLSLGNAFMLGAIALSIVFAMPVVAMIKSIFFSMVYPKTLSLALVVSLILVLSSSMESTGQMQRLLGRFRGLVRSPRLNLVIFPALIGLLPMPGGAVFSAPMVKEMGRDKGLSKDQLSFVNYWLRHVWEYWWPMYPGVLLATLMADINLPVFVVMMVPMTFAAILSGSLPVKGLNGAKPGIEETKRPPIGPFLHELAPILMVIVLGLGSGMVLSHYYPDLTIAKEAGLIISLLFAIAWIWFENRLPAKKSRAIVFNMKMFNMVYMVVAILVFKGILDDSDAVRDISNELIRLHIPLFLIAVILPFIVGVFTGITIAFVGSTFPILISLVQAQGAAGFMPAYMMIGLVCGFAGVLLSPLHLCLLLSNQYFETPLTPVYHHLWRPCSFMMVAAMAYFWILRWIYV
jgi:integral membrane protein (TIGR00529 family)